MLFRNKLNHIPPFRTTQFCKLSQLSQIITIFTNYHNLSQIKPHSTLLYYTILQIITIITILQIITIITNYHNYHKLSQLSQLSQIITIITNYHNYHKLNHIPHFRTTQFCNLLIIRQPAATQILTFQASYYTIWNSAAEITFRWNFQGVLASSPTTLSPLHAIREDEL